MAFSAADNQFMAQALRLAARGLFTTDPNPRVGCVLVRDGAVVGEGWHERAGEPHAEINALRAAGSLARGSTAYVTLEPCSHTGRTPPCVNALVQAGVARVVAAMTDPNPLVSGEGLRALSQAGVQTSNGLMTAEAQVLNPGFVKRMHTGLPFVRLKLATSIDGRTAMASGESKWITGEAARLDVQRLRARSSAVMTGIGTVIHDDPALNVRLDGIARQPIRVVLDPALEMRPGARMLSLAGQTLVFTARPDSASRSALEAAGAEIVGVDGDDRALDLGAVLKVLAEREVNELHVETGATLAGSLLGMGLVDELVLYVAPLVMGDGARGLFHLPALASMDQRIELDIIDVRAVGRDWRVTAGVASS
jgi:diaminohydroxyphosphoribosylaminopyrimidine deaminase/5-amino-6-(5-phosphoribosylamino)uracil reductase